MATMTTTSAPSRRDGTEGAPRTVAPPVDIYETDDAFVLLADMPGVAPAGLDVVAERDELIISGQVEALGADPDYQEFELAGYRRAFTLTEDLDTERITAALKDGVLRVEIPKSPRVQPRKIPVRTE
ncbi:MAG: Hsp20/alpha crystallin family protein [Candidatus Rokubacteria bacterium]|nr:Hsp20/alpha crystallin family protein [Candidatus Rokubacteria bacterium]